MTATATSKLHDLGQSLWLDNITRDLLASGTLKRYIDELSVTGLTSMTQRMSAPWVQGQSPLGSAVRRR